MFSLSPGSAAPSHCAAGSFSTGNGLAGQGALVDGQGHRREQPSVSRHDVAGPEQHDVTSDDLSCEDVAHGAAPSDPGEGRRHIPQRFKRALGTRLLERTNQSIDDQDRQDDDGVLGVPGRERDRRRDDQQ